MAARTQIPLNGHTRGGPESAFPSIFQEFDNEMGATPKTRKELKILQLLGSIREKPKWWEKVHDADIVSKWRGEAARQVDDDEFDFALKELREVSSDQVRDGVGPIEVEGAYGADGLIDDALKSELQAVLQPFESLPDDEKDWHPNTNQQVLNLIHPSLYCAVNGFTCDVKEEEIPREDALNWIGKGEPVSFKDIPRIIRLGTDAEFYSGKFQWLPSDFEISEDGTDVRILSYINNLHPKTHSAAYKTISKIFAKFVPLFESTLTRMKADELIPARTHVDMYALRDEVEANEDDEDEDADYGFGPVTKFPQLVEFEEFRDAYKSTMEEPFSLKGKRVQVIVKAANIVLTPEKPEYPGGTWHVEGMANEAIIATGIYYYDMANVGESRLAFRQAVADCDYEQNDRQGVATIFGLRDEGPMNQELGSVQARDGRCIVFPNLLQHRVNPFKLADASQPGHRKILVFFLVDPTVKVLSTSRVPPQQHEWYSDLLKKDLESKMPEDVAAKTAAMSEGSFTMTRAKAIEHRAELMAERSVFVKDHNEDVFERPFSLCEH